MKGPVQFMLNQYKNYLKENYFNSFNNSELNQLKLEGFCKAIITFLDFKGYNNFHCEKNSSKNIDIFYDSTLLVTYNIELLKDIKSESSLKFHFLIEWGIFLELLDKKQLLIAL